MPGAGVSGGGVVCVHLNLRILDLKQQGSRFCVGVILLGDSIPRTSYFNCFADRYFTLRGRDGGGLFCSLLGGTLGKVLLVSFSLCVGEVVAFVLVEGETEAAFVLAEMVFHEVRVFGEVDGFEGEATESLPSVDSLHRSCLVGIVRDVSIRMCVHMHVWND